MASSSNRERSRSPLREEPLSVWDQFLLKSRKEAEYRADWLVEEVNPMIESLASDCPADIRKTFLRVKHFCETNDIHDFFSLCDAEYAFIGCKKKLAKFRSCLQPQPLSDLARAALDVVCKRDAEDRIESQRRTIARLQQELASKNAEIASLKAGDGPIGPILMRNLPADFDHDSWYSRESVASFVERVQRISRAVTTELTFGQHSRRDIRSPPPPPRS